MNIKSIQKRIGRLSWLPTVSGKCAMKETNNLMKIVYGTVLPLMLIVAVALSDHANADDAASIHDALIDQISQEVICRLKEDGALDESIERGIERYIDQQQRAQCRAEERARSRSAQLAQSVCGVSPDRDHIYRYPEAPISLIEYSDFECPYCKRFHPDPKELVDSSDGQVDRIYRHFPLEFHNSLAQLEAEASECANEQGGNDAFWQYAELLYSSVERVAERNSAEHRGQPVVTPINSDRIL